MSHLVRLCSLLILLSGSYSSPSSSGEDDGLIFRRNDRHFYHPQPYWPYPYYNQLPFNPFYIKNDVKTQSPSSPAMFSDVTGRRPVSKGSSSSMEDRQLGFMTNVLTGVISRLWSIRQGNIAGLLSSLTTNTDTGAEAAVNGENNNIQPVEGTSVSGLVANLLTNTRTNNTMGGISNPLASIFGSSSPLSINPNTPDMLSMYESCTTSTGHKGICIPGTLCSVYPGTTSNSSCGLLGTNVCCHSEITSCGSTAVLNNTYWKMDETASFKSGSTCSLAIKLDNSLVEQRKPICQVRLDFHSFNLAQPNTESVCDSDHFQVVGAANSVPVICGNNDGHHMYLEATSSVSSIFLNVHLGQQAVEREWNIQVSMIPCGSNFLAPRDCLQYHTAWAGTIKSFNWADVEGSATRQLANQDYRICFRTEKVLGQTANSLCVNPCSTSKSPTAFSLSQATDPAGVTVKTSASQGIATNCNNDYIILSGGFDPARAASLPAIAVDRYCGERLNPSANAYTSTTVCTKMKSFNVHYKTNGDETTTETVDGVAGSDVTNGNLGFCLNFQQRS